MFSPFFSWKKSRFEKKVLMSRGVLGTNTCSFKWESAAVPPVGYYGHVDPGPMRWHYPLPGHFFIGRHSSLTSAHKTPLHPPPLFAFLPFPRPGLRMTLASACDTFPAVVKMPCSQCQSKGSPARPYRCCPQQFHACCIHRSHSVKWL